jgi:hypothetical protein
MTKIQIIMTEKENTKLELYKIKHRLGTKQEALKHLLENLKIEIRG